MNLKTILLICVVWIVISSFYLISISLDAGTSSVVSDGLLKASFIDVIFWSLFCILLYHLLKKPIIEQNFFVVASLFIGVYLLWQPVLLVFNGINKPFFEETAIPSVSEIFSYTRFIYIYFNFIQYLFVFSFCTGLIYYRYYYQIKIASAELEKKTAQVELKFSDMKMQVLQTQLSPHFLFNSLNSISGLIRVTEKNKALDAVASLGHLLRFSLNASKSNFISIREEIEFTNHYVELQRLRFNDFFTFNLKHQSSLSSLLCPPFILQTMIENAFTHAVFNRENIVHINAEILMTNNKLIFSTQNNIPDNEDTEHQGMGMAINNLKDRLALLYHNNYEIKQEISQNTFYSAITIPIDQ